MVSRPTVLIIFSKGSTLTLYMKPQYKVSVISGKDFKDNEQTTIVSRQSSLSFTIELGAWKLNSNQFTA